MRLLDLSSQIFQSFPKLKIYFAVGEFNYTFEGEKIVLAERSALLKTLDFTPHQLVVLSQIHSSKIIYMPNSDWNDFFTREPLEADGMYTDKPEIFLAIRTADCLPILFYNKPAGVAGAIHAGWRGTRNEIIKTAIREIGDRFGATLSGFSFYFGPAAQACCYNVDKYKDDSDFVNYFKPELVFRDKKLFLDFVAANYRQLKEMGVREEQIENSGVCTIHNLEYPSHRREKEKRKLTLLSIIGIKKD